MTSAFVDSVKVRAAVISLMTGVAILALKVAAYLVTGSVALLSDAAESVVNVIAANIALISLLVAVRPPDERHQYGHAKAEYVSSATEAALAVAALANLAVAGVLLRVSRAQHSIALEASAKHLLSDVLTSVGVFAGIGLVMLTGWTPLDPIAAIIVGGNIIWMGVALYRRSLGGLMDARLPAGDEAKIHAILDAHRDEIVDYHALRTRQAGTDRFLDVHLVLHRALTVGQAHNLTDDLEQHIGDALPGTDVTIHVEPCEAACPRCATERSAR